MGATSDPWTMADLNEVDRMWNVEKLSTSKIARAFGVGRGAVAGLMHRNRDRFPKSGPRANASKAGKTSWSAEDHQAAKLLWAKGQDKKAIGEAVGRSVSAVANFMTRFPHDFPARMKVAKPVGRPRAARIIIKDEPLPVPPPAPPDCSPVSLVMRTERQCAYPIWGSEKPHGESPYCGAVVPFEEPYCPFHQRIMYRPRESARAAA